MESDLKTALILIFKLSRALSDAGTQQSVLNQRLLQEAHDFLEKHSHS